MACYRPRLEEIAGNQAQKRLATDFTPSTPEYNIQPPKMHPLRSEIEGLSGRVQDSNVPDSEIKSSDIHFGGTRRVEGRRIQDVLWKSVSWRGIELSLFTASILTSSLISFSSLGTTTAVRSQYILIFID